MAHQPGLQNDPRRGQPAPSLILLFLLLFIHPLGAQERALTEVKELRYWSYPNYTRVTVVLSQRAGYRVFELPADPQRGTPPRIAVDLEETILPSALRREYPVQDGLLKMVRIGQNDRNRVRIVLDLERTGDYEVFVLFDPFRIVVDFFGHRPSPPPLSPPPSPPPSTSPLDSLLTPSPPPKPSAPPSPKKPVVVLDPGHGGKDPGAIGYKGLKEKRIVLDVALRVGRILKKKGIHVVYTRKDDQYLTLEERTLIANREEADLFVSIHANSARNRTANGVETYYLDTTFDRATRILVAQENGMTPEALGELEELLLSLELTSRKQISALLAHTVQSQILSLLNGGRRSDRKVRNLGVKGAPFYVLIGSRMPAVLVEIGFITHPEEAERLKDPRYQEKLAEGIARGILQFLKNRDRVPL